MTQQKGIGEGYKENVGVHFAVIVTKNFLMLIYVMFMCETCLSTAIKS